MLNQKGYEKCVDDQNKHKWHYRINIRVCLEIWKKNEEDNETFFETTSVTRTKRHEVYSTVL
jgi:hypothetical protein